jgi:hypothetical protein
MRRTALAGVVVALALVAVPLVGTAAAQAPDVQAFCAARADLETAFGAGDAKAIKADLVALKANAPSEVATDATLIADLLAKKGEKAFENKKFGAAFERLNTFVLASCGLPEVDVSGIDYEFVGIPDSIPAGMTAFKFSNDAPKEHHEMIVLRVKPGVTDSAKKIVSLPEKKAFKKVDFVAATDAAPGHFGISITDLTPGHYIVACFHPVGGKKDGTPHWKKGMLAEFDVV